MTINYDFTVGHFFTFEYFFLDSVILGITFIYVKQ